MGLEKDKIQTPGTGLRADDATGIQAGAPHPPSAVTDVTNGDADISVQKVNTSHPPAIWFFFWGEFAERSSYYGMRAILFMYMTTALHFSDTEASPIYAAF